MQFLLLSIIPLLNLLNILNILNLLNLLNILLKVNLRLQKLIPIMMAWTGLAWCCMVLYAIGRNCMVLIGNLMQMQFPVS